MFTLINNCKSYSDLPTRKICSTQLRKTSTSYGIILFDRKREMWLAVKKGSSYGFMIFLRAQYRRSDIPIHISDCTENELTVIMKILDGSIQFSELYKLYYKLSPSPDKEALMMDHKDMFLLSIESLEGKYKLWTQWEWPKGRKEHGESQFKAALREFREETQFDGSFTVLRDKKITEEYCGSNGCIYKTIYWVASTNDDRQIRTYVERKCTTIAKSAKSFKDIALCTKEIDKIEWFKDEDICKMLRKEKIESMFKARRILETIS